MKNCPYCNGLNNDDRIKCKYCGQDLVQNVETEVKEDEIYKYHSFLNSDDKVQLGKMYQTGIGCTKNIENTKKLFLDAAAEGNVEAMYLYAEMLYQSSSEEDKKTAISYYKEAAAQGHIGAKLRLKELNKQDANYENSTLMEIVKRVRPYCLEIVSGNLVDIRRANSKEELEELIKIQAAIPESKGSGVLLDNGFIITNAHVIIYAFEFEKQSGISQVIIGRMKNIESQIQLELIYKNEEEDIAILKPVGINLDYSNAPKLMQPLYIQMGQTVFTIGNGYAEGNALTSGQISQELKKNRQYNEVFVTNMVINHGNSGGGVFDLEGNVLGMITYGPQGEKGSQIYGITYCVTANTIQEMINKITKKY